MKCANCNSIIPDDSKFCPDCGKIVVSIDEIRSKVKYIYDNYNVGYKYFMDVGSLPRFKTRLTLASYENILEKEADIKQKHQELKEIERQEAIKEEEQRIRETASRIALVYARGYQFFVDNGILPQYSTNICINDCKKIISKEDEIKNKQNDYFNENESSKSGCLIGLKFILCMLIAFAILILFGYLGLESDSGWVFMLMLALAFYLIAIIANRINPFG